MWFYILLALSIIVRVLYTVFSVSVKLILFMAPVLGAALSGWILTMTVPVLNTIIPGHTGLSVMTVILVFEAVTIILLMIESLRRSVVLFNTSLLGMIMFGVCMQIPAMTVDSWQMGLLFTALYVLTDVVLFITNRIIYSSFENGGATVPSSVASAIISGAAIMLSVIGIMVSIWTPFLKSAGTPLSLTVQNLLIFGSFAAATAVFLIIGLRKRV